jgi:hypothetical protein
MGGIEGGLSRQSLQGISGLLSDCIRCFSNNLFISLCLGFILDVEYMSLLVSEKQSTYHVDIKHILTSMFRVELILIS